MLEIVKFVLYIVMESHLVYIMNLQKNVMFMSHTF